MLVRRGVQLHRGNESGSPMAVIVGVIQNTVMFGYGTCSAAVRVAVEQCVPQCDYLGVKETVSGAHADGCR